MRETAGINQDTPVAPSPVAPSVESAACIAGFTDGKDAPADSRNLKQPKLKIKAQI